MDQGKSVTRKKIIFQRFWGVALILAGIGVFYRTPQIMPKIEQIEQFSSISFFIRFCFYFMGVLLIGGGSKKIYDSSLKPEQNPSNEN